MNVYFRWPGSDLIRQFIAEQSVLGYSYKEQMQSLQEGAKGYDNDYSSLIIGHGEEVWQAAREALQKWNQFPPKWTRIIPETAPLKQDQNIAVMIRLFGFWWMNPTRVVCTFDEVNKFGFAYGTLPAHIEIGEEAFWIERDEKGTVSYHIRAFSKPRIWLTKITYPIVRLCQKRFVRHSMNRMKELVQDL